MVDYHMLSPASPPFRVGNIFRILSNKNQYSELKDCHVLVYDTEQQVHGNHLLCAWETLEKDTELS